MTKDLPAGDLVQELGIAPAWFSGLASGSFPEPMGAGATRTWNAAAVERWLAATRLESSLRSSTVADLRMMARRLRGDSIPQIAADLGRAEHVVSQRSRRVGARLLLQLEPDVVRVLVERRHAGDPDVAVGRRFHSGRSLVQLALDGWSGRARERDELLGRLWTAGESLEILAQRTGRSSQCVSRRAAELALPDRWSRADIARLLRVQRATVTSFGVSRVLPEPAGKLSNGRPWWWKTQIDAWAEQTLQTCPDCGARMVGLPQHRARAHGSSSPAQSTAS